MNKFYYKWRDFEKDSKNLAKKIISSGFNYQVIVAISRGGLCVAGILSQFLKRKPIEVISIYSYKDKKQKSLKVIKEFKTKKKVLICDDVLDTGQTLFEVKRMCPNSKIAVLHFKSQNAIYIEPDFYVKKSKKWIVYPWEVKDK